MWPSIENLFERFHPLTASLVQDAVMIRPARDADLAALCDLAELDGAQPLTGPVLVALVDDRPWAALAVEDGRVVADPFRPSAAAVELLRLRAGQLRAADGRTTGARARVPRLRPRRARA